MSGRPPVAKKRQVPEIRMNRMNDRETMSMLKKWKENKLVSEWNAFWRQEEGVGVIEVVLIRSPDWPGDHLQNADYEASGEYL